MDLNVADRARAETLAPPAAEALTDFARACRSAIHAVSLYPPEHPAIARAVARIREVTDRNTRQQPFRMAVLPSDLLIDGRRLARPEAAVSDIAALLHGHMVGELSIGAGIDEQGWRRFLDLITRAPEDVRDAGGLARAWTTAGGQHIEIREIAYAEVLRDRTDGDRASWDLIIRHCLSSDAIDLDERALDTLIGVLSDPARLSEFALRLDEQPDGGAGPGGKAAALLQILGAVVGALADRDPSQLDSIYTNVAGILGSASPETMLQWLAAAGPGAGGSGVPGAAEVLQRFGDARIAQFLATSIISSSGATARLAEAFQALVADPGRRRRLLGLAEPTVAASPLGRQSGFNLYWKQIEHLLGSYTDKAYVSEEYGAELDGATARATDVEHLAEDPPERLAAWLSSISDQALRNLDAQLLLDLLAVEDDAPRWVDLARVVGGHVNDLVLVGDFEPAARLVEALTASGGRRGNVAFEQAVASTVERLLAGQIVAHLVYHLQTITDDEFQHAKRMARALGQPAVRPLAEALAAEERARARLRLTEILVGFGSLGWESVEQLKQSPNPSVRRTAVILLREFGGSAALPDLEALLDDAEPHVQREAVRAILLVGTDEAYEVLQRALTSGTDRSREAILQHLQGSEDDRLVPLFCYILQHTDPRKGLLRVYLKAIATLGALGGSEAVDALGRVLHRGDWWTPLRNRKLSAAAAQALARTRDPQALAALEEAAEHGRAGVRAAARAVLSSASARPERPRSR